MVAVTKKNLGNSLSSGFLVLTALVLSCVPGLLRAGVALQGPETRTILLVDDHDVLYRAGTVRVLRPLDRAAENPVIAADKPWETLIAYCSVYRDPGTGHYQLWYQACPGCYLCYATSRDGIHWTKPDLGLVEFQGDKHNNILVQWGYGASVLVDRHSSDPARRYKAAFWTRGKEIDGRSIPGTGVAFSPDGIHWSEYSGNPVITGSQGHYIQPPFAGDPRIRTGELGGPPLSTSDVTDAIWDPKRETFAIYAKTWLDGPDGTMHWKRAVVRTESKDFLNWSRPELIIAPDEFDGWDGDAKEVERVSVGGGSGGVQLHSGPAFFYNDVYFSLLQVMDARQTGLQPIELALSRDGLDWERPFREEDPFLPTSSGEGFDAGRIWSNATPVILPDEIRFYYGGYRGRWNQKGARNSQHRPTGIGLARMPRDRFAGVRPLEKIGQITLKAMELSSYRGLTLNADARKGVIRVELLDDRGYRLRGYSKEDAVPIVGDHLSHPVRWVDRAIADLEAGRYRLRIHLDHAVVYAVSLTGG